MDPMPSRLTNPVDSLACHVCCGGTTDCRLTPAVSSRRRLNRTSLVVVGMSLLSACQSGRTPNLDAGTNPQVQQGLSHPVAPQGVGRSSGFTTTGQLTLDGDRTWMVSSITPGKVTAMEVQIGDRIQSGQLVVRLYSRDMENVQTKRQRAATDLQNSRALASQAQREWDRTWRKLSRGTASRARMHAAEAKLQAADSKVLNAETEVLTLDAELATMTNSETQTSGGIIQIVSPASGIVVQRPVSVGNVVSRGTALVVISDLSSLWLTACVSGMDASRARFGQEVRVLAPSLPSRVFPGKILQVSGLPVGHCQTASIRVSVVNASGLLKPDMPATVEFDAVGDPDKPRPGPGAQDPNKRLLPKRRVLLAVANGDRPTNGAVHSPIPSNPANVARASRRQVPELRSTARRYQLC